MEKDCVKLQASCKPSFSIAFKSNARDKEEKKACQSRQGDGRRGGIGPVVFCLANHLKPSIFAVAPLDVPHAVLDLHVFGLRRVFDHGQQREVLLGGAGGCGLAALGGALIGVLSAEVLVVVGGALGGKMGVVHGWEEGDWGGCADVLVAMLVDEHVNVVLADARLVQEDVVVDRASCTLEGGVGAHIEVVLEWVGDSGLDQGTWQRVAVSVSASVVLGEEAHVVAL